MGAVKLDSRIGQLVQRVRVGAEAANANAARNIARAASQNAPQRSGRLARSIKAKPADGIDWEVTTDVFYAHLVEWGAVQAGAQPFLTPAVEGEREAHAAAIRALYR